MEAVEPAGLGGGGLAGVAAVEAAGGRALVAATAVGVAEAPLPAPGGLTAASAADAGRVAAASAKRFFSEASAALSLSSLSLSLYPDSKLLIACGCKSQRLGVAVSAEGTTAGGLVGAWLWAGTARDEDDDEAAVVAGTAAAPAGMPLLSLGNVARGLCPAGGRTAGEGRCTGAA